MSDKIKLLPCPCCGGTELKRQTMYRDHFDIQNARKDVMKMTLVHCEGCFTSAMENVWNMRPFAPNAPKLKEIADYLVLNTGDTLSPSAEAIAELRRIVNNGLADTNVAEEDKTL